MSSLEHLIENGLNMIYKYDHDMWYKKMKNDPNILFVKMSLDELWEICQYIKYNWLPYSTEEQDDY